MPPTTQNIAFTYQMIKILGGSLKIDTGGDGKQGIN